MINKIKKLFLQFIKILHFQCKDVLPKNIFKPFNISYLANLSIYFENKRYSFNNLL